jgi:S1-C subfamily serine protease
MTTGGKMALRYVGNTVIDDGRDPDVVVLVVDPDSPASQAGLAVGDVILEVNGVSVHDRTAAVLRLATGVSYALRIRRGQDELEATLVPGPERAVARPRGLQ